jgi:uncharacterized membrane protein YedE/YeeE
MFVMAGALGLNLITFHFILKREKPLYSDNFCVPKGDVIDIKLIVGTLIFGLGWGLGGLCPGPGMITFFTVPYIAFWILGMIVGQVGHDYMAKQYQIQKKDSL